MGFIIIMLQMFWNKYKVKLNYNWKRRAPQLEWNSLIFIYFLLNLLGWHWLIKVYRFQVYNSIIHHLYIVLWVHHPKSSLLPSPFMPPLLSSTPPHAPSLWQSPSCRLHPHESFLSFAESLHPSHPASPLTAISLFSVSMSLSPLC